ncbi:NAD-dependent epimerase/dehydratase family protein [Candidatus Skiveiella danica]|uniref:NAD-dependent epimerase/dehydratase family protein n=1 Tax=Candidatus Skiveiella danica TaxID=3386177 RepID=UPI001DA23612|nr:NAD-dependent epimerase/dehydratase family protein [Betaproteobacteria bacterium]
MNILLTGGTGYIGSHTAVALAEAGHRKRPSRRATRHRRPRLGRQPPHPPPPPPPTPPAPGPHA